MFCESEQDSACEVDRFDEGGIESFGSGDREHVGGQVLSLDLSFGNELPIGPEVFEDIVGPKEKVTWADSALAFACFYNIFLVKGKPLNEAVNRMNMAAGYDCPVFETVSGSALRAQFSKDLVKRMVATIRDLQRQSRQPNIS